MICQCCDEHQSCGTSDQWDPLTGGDYGVLLDPDRGRAGITAGEITRIELSLLCKDYRFGNEDLPRLGSSLNNSHLSHLPLPSLVASMPSAARTGSSLKPSTLVASPSPSSSIAGSLFLDAACSVHSPCSSLQRWSHLSPSSSITGNLYSNAVCSAHGPCLGL